MLTPLGSRAAIGFGLGMSRPVAAAAGWWLTGGINPANCVAAYQPIGAASLAASYVNLANPGTYDAAPGVAPSFDAATGWTFNGSTQYLTTGVVPAAISWSYIVRFSDTTNGGNVYLFGMYAGSNNTAVNLRPTSGGSSYFVNGGIVAGAPKTSGVMAIAGANTYIDGALNGTITQVGPPANKEIFIATLNYSAFAYYLACYVQAFSIYNIDISANVAALTAAMAAL